MPEMFTLLPHADALAVLIGRLKPSSRVDTVPTADALGRVLAAALHAPSDLPAFARSTMDGYAVRSSDTFGASESLPAYLGLVGEVLMGRAAGTPVDAGQAVLIHTGAMLPPAADAVVMVEQTQRVDGETIEVFRAVAPGENMVAVGEDIRRGVALLPAGHRLRPQDIGGLMALGITTVPVTVQPRVAIISTGDEIVHPDVTPGPGQVRDVNTYTVAGVVAQAGAVPLARGVVRDDLDSLEAACRAALADADVLVLSAGSSVSARDLTATVVDALGEPGVLVHGLAVKPGKPTILAACGNKPVVGLPGNPVGAMVVATLILAPLLAHLQGEAGPPVRTQVTAVLARNLSSAPGREDHVSVRLAERDGLLWAEPVLGKSNLIFTLIKADGDLCIPLDSGGLHAGETVSVQLF